MEPELVNEVLVKNNVFKKQSPTPLQKLLLCGLASYENEKWAKHRKIMTPAFYSEKLKRMLPAMHLSCSEMIRKWDSKLLPENNCTWEMDVLPELHDLTSDVISRTAFGSCYDEGRRIFELQKQLAHHTAPLMFSGYIPGWRFIPTKRNRKMKEINNEMRGLVMGIISRREKAIKLGESNEEDDLLGILLNANLNEIKEHGNNKKAGMSMEDVVDECKLLYLAGQETTANVLAWTMILLSMHPDWQARARDEVLKVFGKNKPEYDGLSHLRIVTMILNEVLRLYPPVPTLTRVAENDTTIGEMKLPAGTRLQLPLIFLHRDPEIWGEDAKEFKPERFSSGVAKASKKQQLAFFPFSWGPRTCIGNNFAMMEAKIVVSMILQRFSFQLSPAYTHAPCFVVTVQPQNGAHLILHKL